MSISYDLLLYAYFSCVCFSSDIFSCYFIHVSFIFSLCCKAELPQVIFTDSLYYSILAQALRTSTKTHLSTSLWLDVYSSFCKPIWSMYIIDTFTYLYKRRVLFRSIVDSWPSFHLFVCSKSLTSLQLWTAATSPVKLWQDAAAADCAPNSFPSKNTSIHHTSCRTLGRTTLSSRWRSTPSMPPSWKRRERRGPRMEIREFLICLQCQAIKLRAQVSSEASMGDLDAWTLTVHIGSIGIFTYRYHKQ